MTTLKLDYTSAIILSLYGDKRREYNPDYINVLRSFRTIDKPGTWDRDALLFEIPGIPSEYHYKKLIRADVFGTVRKSYTDLVGTTVIGLIEPTDINSAVWSDLPGATLRDVDSQGDWQGYSILGNGVTIYDQVLDLTDYFTSYQETTSSDPDLNATVGSKYLLQNNQILILLDGTNKDISISGDIYVNVLIDEAVTITSQVEPINSQTSGWLNPAIQNTFSWQLTWSGDYTCYADFEQQSGTFYWREGTTGEWNAVPAAGNTTNVIIPANTFPGGTIQWYVSSTDTQGTRTQTPIYTITTEDSEAVAEPISPINVAIGGNADTLFEWTVQNSTGSVPTGSDLQYSTDLVTWLDFATISGSATQYTAPADIFPSGTVYWRVRAYNRDSVAGEWSAAAAFLCIKAPAAPSVTVQAVPFAVINWQSVDQMAYRITIDGISYGPFFGSAKSFTLPDYLADGQHTASVEIQGYYGLWSDPGTASFNVTNRPGAAVTLSGVFGADARLSWQTSEVSQDFFVYRNDVRIGHTAGTSFNDRTSVGGFAWYVINRLPDGNYTKSNVVSGTVQVESAAIAAADGGEWIELRLTENSLKQTIFSYSRTHVLRHVTGTDLPVLELSPYEDETVAFDAAFVTAEDSRRFEALRGRVVFLKIRDEEIVIGGLTALQKTVNGFYRTYSFTIRKIHWEDFVDDTNA